MTPEEKLEQYLISNGWSSDIKNQEISEWKEKLKNLYLVEYECNLQLNKQLKNLDKFTVNYNFPNMIEKIDDMKILKKLETEDEILKKLETEDEILEYSINNLNKVISKLFKV